MLEVGREDQGRAEAVGHAVAVLVKEEMTEIEQGGQVEGGWGGGGGDGFVLGRGRNGCREGGQGGVRERGQRAEQDGSGQSVGVLNMGMTGV